MNQPINVFKVHSEIMLDYRLFVDSFIHIKDDRIREQVETELKDGRYWPEPLVQFNPSYAAGESIDDLIVNGSIDSELNSIFVGYELCQHQVEAIKLGTQGKGFVVTSGTGSGKSLAYLATVFNHLIQHKGSSGNTAVLVYPKNVWLVRPGSGPRFLRGGIPPRKRPGALQHLPGSLQGGSAAPAQAET